MREREREGGVGNRDGIDRGYKAEGSPRHEAGRGWGMTRSADPYGAAASLEDVGAELVVAAKVLGALRVRGGRELEHV